MSWYEINVKTSEAAIDAVTNLLYGYGATGVMINNPNDEEDPGCRRKRVSLSQRFRK